jgi:hypothetical protein
MVVDVNSFGQSAVFIKERFNASQNYVMKVIRFIFSYTVASYNPRASVVFCTFFTGLHAQV